MIDIALPLRLRIDSAALVSNWRWLAARSDAACGAAIKADGYGLGARKVMQHLAAAGCRDFFVATWTEAAALIPLAGELSLSVLHGEGRPCDVMIDTGMNRLGLRIEEALGGALEGLAIETLLSHLASADEDSEQNARQLAAFQSLRQQIAARRYSLANSAGICLGADYAFDLTRPGLALYGGVDGAARQPHRGGEHGLCRRLSALPCGIWRRRMASAQASPRRPCVDGPDRLRCK